MGTGEIFTLLGKTGEGIGKGMTEAIKYEIMKRRDDALFQREKTLEEYRHGKRTEEEEKKYGRRTAEEEKTYQRRREEEGIEYKGRRKKEQEEYESRLLAKGKEPSEEQKKYEFYVNTFGKEEALKLIRGKTDKFTTAQLDTLKYAADLVLGGNSAEEVNAVLEAAGIEEQYVEYETGEKEDIEGTGFWGFGKKQRNIKELRLGSRPKGLLGGVRTEAAPTTGNIREKLYPGEDAYFKAHPETTGMAAKDNSIILNPYSNLTEQQKQAVIQNESARIQMRISGIRPTFKITPEQKEIFKGYGTEQDIRETIVGRIISGDLSAGSVTEEQRAFVAKIQGEAGDKKAGEKPESEFDRIKAIIESDKAPVKTEGGLLKNKSSGATGTWKEIGKGTKYTDYKPLIDVESFKPYKNLLSKAMDISGDAAQSIIKASEELGIKLTDKTIKALTTVLEQQRNAREQLGR